LHVLISYQSLWTRLPTIEPKATMHYGSLLCYLAPYIAFSIAEDSSGGFDITSVTNGTFAVLGITKSIFSLQDALFPNDYASSTLEPNYVADYLFVDACQQADTTSNCTVSCKDKSLMFANLETLHNCMVSPKVAMYYYANNMTQNARNLVEQLGIEASNNSSDSSRNVTSLIQTCLTDYCTSIKGCQATYDSDYESDNENATAYKDVGNWNFDEEGSYLVRAICESLKSQFQVNSDIGGIGV